jgi:chloramphenicol-sensitive protein RarD
MSPEETPLSNARRETMAGVLYAGTAFLIWGLSPVYWKAMQRVPALEIVTHRVVWSFLFLMGLTWFQHRCGEFKDVFYKIGSVLFIEIL